MAMSYIHLHTNRLSIKHQIQKKGELTSQTLWISKNFGAQLLVI